MPVNLSSYDFNSYNYLGVEAGSGSVGFNRGTEIPGVLIVCKSHKVRKGCTLHLVKAINSSSNSVL